MDQPIKEKSVNDISELNNLASVELCEQIHSHRKILRGFVILIKRIMRKSIVWFIRPIVNKQNKFNIKVTELVEILLNEVAYLDERNIKIQEKVTEVDQKIIEVDQKVTEVDEKVTEVDQKVKKLEELNIQMEEYNLKLNKLKQIESKVLRIEETFKIELAETNEFFNKKSYSQAGEDTIIAYIFKYLGVDVSNIKYLDLGANHAKELSNTNYFYENGARGVLVEANPSLIPELHFYRHNDIILNNLVSTLSNEELDFYVLSGDGLSTPDREHAEETCRMNPAIKIDKIVKVTSITVNDIFEKYFGGISPNFISIDIEGYDLEIIKSIDLEKYRPFVIVVETIEYRPYLPINVKVNCVTKYLGTYDYVEYAFTGINSIFIDARYMNALNQDK